MLPALRSRPGSCSCQGLPQGGLDSDLLSPPKTLVWFWLLPEQNAKCALCCVRLPLFTHSMSLIALFSPPTLFSLGYPPSISSLPHNPLNNVTDTPGFRSHLYIRSRVLTPVQIPHLLPQTECLWDSSPRGPAGNPRSSKKHTCLFTPRFCSPLPTHPEAKLHHPGDTPEASSPLLGWAVVTLGSLCLPRTLWIHSFLSCPRPPSVLITTLNYQLL